MSARHMKLPKTVDGHSVAKVAKGLLAKYRLQVAEEASRELAELERLRAELADSAATSDIETYCKDIGRHPVSGMPVYDTAQIQNCLGHPVCFDAYEHEFLRKAYRYLELRGLLVRDAATPHIVSFQRE